jgi:hypothetical protein
MAIKEPNTSEIIYVIMQVEKTTGCIYEDIGEDYEYGCRTCPIFQQLLAEKRGLC